MSEILLRNLRITDCERTVSGDVLVRDGLIARVGENLRGSGREVDGSGYALLPAFVDLHSHFRDPGLTHKEDLGTGCRAAVHGGYTAVHLMGNTKPVCSTRETVAYVREKAAALGLCDVYQAVSITKDFDGRTLSHLEDLEESVRWLSDDGCGVADTAVMLRAMETAREKGVGVMLHEEDAALTRIDSYRMEDIPTYRDVELALLTGCRTHFCHVSTIGSIEHIRRGKALGGSITCEVTPHHLCLNDQNPGRVAPPLRGEAHRLHLIKCVREGVVDAIATDHAPHTPEEKAAGANGFTGLDLSFAACYTCLVRGGHIGLETLSRLMSRRPAELLGLDRGFIREGMPADLVLVDLDRSFTVDEACFRSKGKNSPLLGETLWGEIQITIKEGRIVYEKGAY